MILVFEEKIFVYDNHYNRSLIKPSVIVLILDSDIKFKNICLSNTCGTFQIPKYRWGDHTVTVAE